MLMMMGELIDVQTGDFNSLVFKSSKFDFGLGQEVPSSESVAIFDETKQFVANYKSHIGERVALPVRVLKTKKGGILLVANSDILDLAQVLTSES